MNKNLKLKDGSVFFVLAGLTIVSLVPFLWMISTSLKGAGALMSIPVEWIPKEVTFASYVKIFTKLPFMKSLFNSILVSVSSTLLTIFSASLAAFVFAKFDFKYKNLLFTLF
jgi:multiple sugar transport system permease protein